MVICGGCIKLLTHGTVIEDTCSSVVGIFTMGLVFGSNISFVITLMVVGIEVGIVGTILVGLVGSTTLSGRMAGVGLRSGLLML